MRGDRRLEPGERRHGFVLPVPHTRSARKSLHMYLTTLRPHVHDIVATLKVPDEILRPGTPAREVGAAYLSAFLDELSVHLLNRE
ncbi:MAG: hypothetical protein QN168_12640 [Armatimonadota bacterium]|nr:hypothetical protein [Armatimonadota bacterium]